MRTLPVRAIVAATELSEASDAVVEAAGRLAALSGAPLHLVHAFDLAAGPYMGPAFGEPALMLPDVHSFQDRVRQAEEALDAQAARTLPAGVTVGTRQVMIYAAHRAILERAEAVDADLLVLGPHRRRAMADGLLGSTADRVLRSAAAPCLVVRGRLDMPLRRVVVPLDLSEPSREALDVAIRWAVALGCEDTDEALPAVELKVVHVIPRFLIAPDLPFDHATVGPRLHSEVEAALAAAGGACGVDVQEELLFGESTAEALTRYAAEKEVDLIVMATHGYGALRRALIGSVASGVAREAPCPVLLVPPGYAIAGTGPRTGAAAAGAGQP